MVAHVCRVYCRVREATCISGTSEVLDIFLRKNLPFVTKVQLYKAQEQEQKVFFTLSSRPCTR